MSTSPRKTASKPSLLLTPVQHGLSRGTLCQKPLTLLKVKFSLCLVNLVAPFLYSILIISLAFILPSSSCPCLQRIAYQPHLPPPTLCLPSLPHALAGLFARSKNKQHTTGKAGCLHIEIVCFRLMLLLPGDSQWPHH